MVATRQSIATRRPSGWDVLIDGAKSCLLHCDCPWGGELLKIRVDAHAPWPPRERNLALPKRLDFWIGSGSDFAEMLWLP